MRLPIVTLVLSFTELCAAVICFQPRSSDSLSASDLTKFIRDKLQDSCRILSSNTNGTASVQQQGYFLLATYDSTSDPPQATPNNATLCSIAFNEILDQCVVTLGSFGGQFVLFEQTYNLTNVNFPLDPFSKIPQSSQTAPTTLYTSVTISSASTVPTSTAVVAIIAADISSANAAIAALLLAPSASLAAVALEAVNTALLAVEVAFTVTAAGPLFVALSALVEQLLVASQAASNAVAFPGSESATALGTTFAAVIGLVASARAAEDGAPQSTQATPTESSSSTCSASTVNSCDITTLCPTPTLDPGSSVSCTTMSTCVKVTGCSITATTTETCVNSILSPARRAPGAACAAPTSKPHIIYPRDGTNIDHTTSIVLGFLSLGVPLSPPFYTSKSSAGLGVSFWYAILTPDQVIALQSNENVLSVHSVSAPSNQNVPPPTNANLPNPDENTPAELPRSVNLSEPAPLDQRGTRIRKREIVEQLTAVDELTLISQPPGFTFEELGNRYTYNDTTLYQTRYQILYSLDNGADLNNQEFTSIAGSAEWLYPGPYPADSPGDVPTYHRPDGFIEGGHGSCMLSKMAGARYGIARGAKPVLTRIIKGDLPERWLDGLQMIYDHIIANNNQGKAVVSMAVSIKKWYVSEGWINRFSYILQQLVLQGQSDRKDSGAALGVGHDVMNRL